MEQLKNKITESLIQAQEFSQNTFQDLKKAYANKEEGEQELARIAKFIAAAKNIGDNLYRAAKTNKCINEKEAKGEKEDIRIANIEYETYPPEMADMIAGMTPQDHNFIKSIQPEIAKMLGEEK